MFPLAFLIPGLNFAAFLRSQIPYEADLLSLRPSLIFTEPARRKVFLKDLDHTPLLLSASSPMSASRISLWRVWRDRWLVEPQVVLFQAAEKSRGERGDFWSSFKSTTFIVTMQIATASTDTPWILKWHTKPFRPESWMNDWWALGGFR